MGEVVYINNAEAGEMHLSGEAFCTNCNKEWMTVAPVGVKELECPHCLTMKGVFKHHVAPITPEVWQCECGNKLFFLLKKQIQCVECGTLTHRKKVT